MGQIPAPGQQSALLPHVEPSGPHAHVPFSELGPQQGLVPLAAPAETQQYPLQERPWGQQPST